MQSLKKLSTSKRKINKDERIGEDSKKNEGMKVIDEIDIINIEIMKEIIQIGHNKDRTMHIFMP